MLNKYYWISEWRKARVCVCVAACISLSPSPTHTHSFIYLIRFIEHLSPREREKEKSTDAVSLNSPNTLEKGPTEIRALSICTSNSHHLLPLKELESTVSIYKHLSGYHRHHEQLSTQTQVLQVMTRGSWWVEQAVYNKVHQEKHWDTGLDVMVIMRNEEIRA